MKYAFDILTQVQFKHSYFSDKVFNGLAVSIDADTQRTLSNLGLLYKAFNGGFYILYDKNLANNPRERADVLSEKVILNFTLELRDSSFYNYTAGLPQQIDNSIYHFHNTLNSTSGSLHAADYVSEKDVVELSDSRHHFMKKPFGKISLLVNPGMSAEYQIAFEARQTYWRYILIGDYLQNLNSPAILDDQDTNIFGDHFEITLPDAKKALGFVSTDKLNLSQKPSKIYRLVENFQTGSSTHRNVIKALPYPDVQYISRIPVKDTNPINYSDIFIN